jgi:hypothetical protein
MMNERIQELAYDAEEYADTMVDGGSDFHPTFVKKFAELIIRECAKSANDWYQNHDKIHSDPMSYVLAHFGVEE